MANILLVDDEPSARVTLGLLLKRRGHAVQEAEGVVAARQALANAAFDVVITDLKMPDGQGLDVLQTARARYPDANVILLTAHPGWESAREAMRLGAFDYFEKGQEPDGLFRRIDKALEDAVTYATDRYRYGRASYYEVLEAQQQLYPAQSTLAQIRRDRLLAYVQLYKALGGGWSLTDSQWGVQGKGSDG